MSTTTLKLSEALKARIAKAAKRSGQSAHAFMVEAIEAETRRAELRREFVATALKAEQHIADYGEVYAADAAHRFFNDKLAGKSARRPKPTTAKISKARG